MLVSGARQNSSPQTIDAIARPQVFPPVAGPGGRDGMGTGRTGGDAACAAGREPAGCGGGNDGADGVLGGGGGGGGGAALIPGIVIDAWQVGQLIWRPAQFASNAMCWPQLGQETFESLMVTNGVVARTQSR